MKGLIEKRSSMDVLEAQARKEGMLTMLEDGVVKAAAKLTSIEEVFRVISE
jgi:type II secretory ATPase GspE/PulE/Tfp pilus assembly ATPase PilB-like protein